MGNFVEVKVSAPEQRLQDASWLRVLVVGLAAWFIAIGITSFTQDQVLIPAVFLIGSFVVPFALLMWVLDRTGWGRNLTAVTTALDPYLLVLAFAAGGALGVLSSALLESLLLMHLQILYYLDVAVVEECVKLALVWLLARRLAFYCRRDGMLLGATVGLGFSGFESAGYSFNAFISHRTVDVLAIAETQISRGLLTPIGHALWTGLLAGALFASAKDGRLRLTKNVGLWLAIVIGLHALWDMALGVAAILAARTVGLSASAVEFETGQLTNPELSERVAFFAYQSVLLCLVGGFAVTLGLRMWRRANEEIVHVAAAGDIGEGPKRQG